MVKFISLLFFWLPFATAANSTYTPRILCIDEASPHQLSEINLRLYTGPTVDNYTIVPIEDALELFDKMDSSKPTVVYIFGWISSADLPITITFVDTYLQRGDHNILLFDWIDIAHTPYGFSARSMEGMGYTLATALNKLVGRGLTKTGMNIVGHSMGAHMASWAGKFLNFSLDRITGLDPAGPGFTYLFEHLAVGDANFVVNIHTDIGAFGTTLETGDVDFYLNGGTDIQPGCEDQIGPVLTHGCSHVRAIYYYIASVKNETSMIGIKCDSESDFEAGSCSSNPTAVVGYATPTNASGKYYLKADVRTLDVDVADDDMAVISQSAGYLWQEVISFVTTAIRTLVHN